MLENVNYNISYLEQISNNDEVFIEDMINTFVTNTPKYFENIDIFYTEKDFDSLYKEVHKFIPTLAFVCEQDYIAKFEKLEKLALAKEDSKELRKLISELRIYSDKIIDLLKKDYNL
jgi:HPt (histidine-containing phosphotransfer) domain-containing protein